MKKQIIIVFLAFIFLFVLSDINHARERLHPEKYYQKILCDRLQGEQEFVLPDKSRIDCLTNKQAIEFDFAEKWAEGLGQALFYGAMTGRRPAVALIMETEEDEKHFIRLNFVVQQYGLGVDIYRVKPDMI